MCSDFNRTSRKKKLIHLMDVALCFELFDMHRARAMTLDSNP